MVLQKPVNLLFLVKDCIYQLIASLRSISLYIICLLNMLFVEWWVRICCTAHKLCDKSLTILCLTQFVINKIILQGPEIKQYTSN